MVETGVVVAVDYHIADHFGNCHPDAANSADSAAVAQDQDIHDYYYTAADAVSAAVDVEAEDLLEMDATMVTIEFQLDHELNC